MKLFMLKRKSTNVLVSNEFYKSKVEAKKARDELNKNSTNEYVVSPGPDHKKYKK